MADAIRIQVPATSANLGPGHGVLALALDVWNEVVVTPRPGPLTVTVTGAGAGELPEDADNLVCRALAQGLGTPVLTDLAIECVNRIPVGAGQGSAVGAVVAGLVGANALGVLRWSPDDLVARAQEVLGHAHGAGACVWGGIVAVAPGGRTTMLPVPDDLLFVVVTPTGGVESPSLPSSAPLTDVAAAMGNAVALALAFERGRLDDLPLMLQDAIGDPEAAARVPGLAVLRELVDGDECRGVTVSGNGPSALMWCDRAAAGAVAQRADEALRAAEVAADVSALRIAPGGARCRWVDAADTRLAKAVG